MADALGGEVEPGVSWKSWAPGGSAGPGGPAGDDGRARGAPERGGGAVGAGRRQRSGRVADSAFELHH